MREALGGRLGEAHVEVRSRSKAAAGARALIEGRPVSLALFDSERLRGFVRRMLDGGRIGTVFAFSGQMAQFVPAGLGQRFVMDFGDVDSAKFAQYADDGAGPMRWVNRREGEKLAAFERATAERADLCLFVSEAEAALFRSRTGLGNVRALSNGIDTAYFDPAAEFPRLAPAERPLLLFTGQMDYPPNADAVVWFARDVLPLIPDAHFAIAGRNPLPSVQALAGERVTVTGGVADMRSWLAAAELVAAPLRLARGIQNKVLEAMAMAKPVVASPAAFEGIDALPGRDLLVADERGCHGRSDRGPARRSGTRRRARRRRPAPDAGGLSLGGPAGAACRHRRPGRAQGRGMTAALALRLDRASPWRTHLAALGAVCAAILALFHRDAAGMASIWWPSSTFNHCLLIPPIVAWLVWQRLPQLGRLTPAAWAPGLALVAGGALAWLLGEAGGIGFARHLGLVVMLQGAVVACLGKAVARGLALSARLCPVHGPGRRGDRPGDADRHRRDRRGLARAQRRARPSRGRLHHHADRLFRGRRGLRWGQVPDRHAGVRRARRQPLLPRLAAPDRLPRRLGAGPDPRQRRARLGDDLDRPPQRQHRLRRELRPCRLRRRLLRDRDRR